jgi:hypothetical protein
MLNRQTLWIAMAVAGLGVSARAESPPQPASGLEGLSGADVLWVASHLRGGGPAESRAREKLATHVERTYLATIDRTQKLSVGQWQTLAHSLGRELPEDRRQRWTRALRDCYVADKSLPQVKDARPLADALRCLGDPGANGVLAAWVKRSKKWKKWDTGRHLGLARDLSKIGPDGYQAKTALGNEVVSQLTKKDKGSGQPIIAWRYMAKELAPCVHHSVATRWARALTKPYVSKDKALRSLGSQECFELARVLNKLDPRESAKWVKHLMAEKGLEKFTDAQLSQLAAWLLDGDAKVPREALTKLTPRWEKSYQNRKLSWQQCIQVAWVHLFDNNAKLGQKWVRRALGKAAREAKPGEGMALELASIATKSGVISEHNGSREYTAIVAGLAAKGTLGGPYYDPKEWAVALRDPLSRRVLEKSLVGKDGQPRLDVGELLGHVYRSIGEKDEWVEKLQAKMGRATDSDTRALWLGVTAQAKGLVPAGREGIPGKADLLKALGIARSQSVRLALLGKLARCYAGIGMHKKGLAAIRSMKNQFSQEYREKLTALESQLKKGAKEKTARRRMVLAIREDLERQHELAYLRKRLAVLERRGSTAADAVRKRIEKLETASTSSKKDDVN